MLSLISRHDTNQLIANTGALRLYCGVARVGGNGSLDNHARARQGRQVDILLRLPLYIRPRQREVGKADASARACIRDS